MEKTLAENLAFELENCDENFTFDDFYDKYNVSKSQRSDYATAILLKQAKEIMGE